MSVDRNQWMVFATTSCFAIGGNFVHLKNLTKEIMVTLNLVQRSFSEFFSNGRIK